MLQVYIHESILCLDHCNNFCKETIHCKQSLPGVGQIYFNKLWIVPMYNFNFYYLVYNTDRTQKFLQVYLKTTDKKESLIFSLRQHLVLFVYYFDFWNLLPRLITRHFFVLNSAKCFGLCGVTNN